MNSPEKLRTVIVGHVDHGKSSLIGRLLYDTKSIPQDKINEVENISKRQGKDMEYAYLLDYLQEEREQGITIDTTQTFFKTAKREYVIIDAPGHVEFIKNMITGASQAEVAILIIDAKEKIQEQTKRHAVILSLLGIKQLIIVVNKMDLVDYDKEAFENIKCEINKFLKSLGLVVNYTIPISAIKGDNITNPSSNMASWYTGPTILEALDSIESKETGSGGSMVLPIQDVYKINNKRISVGFLELGEVSVGSEVLVMPTRSRTKISSIEKFLERVEQAKAGESIGITTDDPVFVERGSVICLEESRIELSNSFKASIFWMSQAELNTGEKITIRCATQEVNCEVNQIYRKINSSTMEYIYDNLDTLTNLEVGEVRITTKKPISVATFSDLQMLGRFVLVKNNNICAGGIVTGIQSLPDYIE